MNIKDLMSGIAVVIDDAFQKDGEKDDKIVELVKNMESTWDILFYRTHQIPSDTVCNNILQSASFILLDWKLWPGGGQNLEDKGVKRNINFLIQAKDYFVPVFIFTNENPQDIIDKFPDDLYDKNATEKNFIFIKRKPELMSNDFDTKIETWLKSNASVYTLKVWEQEFSKAKRSLFGSMYAKSPDWPKVFWDSYKGDGVDQSLSMTNLINQSLLGRIGAGNFENAILDGEPNVTQEEIQQVIEGASFIQKEQLSEKEIRAGDLFKLTENEYLINIRPDCDCIPRNNSQDVDSVELYCIGGKRMKGREVEDSYNKKIGTFNERVWESISFAVHENKTIRFNFRKFSIKNFSEIKDKRVGRLIHPYITRIQQRYALYLQRQGLPRIPERAVGNGTTNP